MTEGAHAYPGLFRRAFFFFKIDRRPFYLSILGEFLPLTLNIGAHLKHNQIRYDDNINNLHRE